MPETTKRFDDLTRHERRALLGRCRGLLRSIALRHKVNPGHVTRVYYGQKSSKRIRGVILRGLRERSLLDRSNHVTFRM